ncbi:MAG: CBS domain-containing protein [Bauldia sp.]
MLVRDYLPTASKRLITLTPDDTIQEAARRLAPAGFDLIVIVDGAGKMIGVVTDSDIVNWVATHEGQATRQTKVSTIMSTKTTKCLPSQSLSDVAELAQKNGRKHLPIVDENEIPLGVVYVRDALMALLNDAEINERWLNAYFTGST